MVAWNGARQPAVLQPTKQGLLFTLNRDTGYSLGLDGQLISLFVIVLAAAEAAVALAITLNFYNNHATVDVDRADELKG